MASSTIKKMSYIPNTPQIISNVTSLDVLKSNLQNIANNLDIDELVPIRFYSSFTGNGFVTALRYFGFLCVFQKDNSIANAFSILFVGEEGHVVAINNHRATWHVKELQTVN